MCADEAAEGERRCWLRRGWSTVFNFWGGGLLAVRLRRRPDQGHHRRSRRRGSGLSSRALAILPLCRFLHLCMCQATEERRSSTAMRGWDVGTEIQPGASLTRSPAVDWSSEMKYFINHLVFYVSVYSHRPRPPTSSALCKPWSSCIESWTSPKINLQRGATAGRPTASGIPTLCFLSPQSNTLFSLKLKAFPAGRDGVKHDHQRHRLARRDDEFVGRHAYRYAAGGALIRHVHLALSYSACSGPSTTCLRRRAGRPVVGRAGIAVLSRLHCGRSPRPHVYI